MKVRIISGVAILLILVLSILLYANIHSRKIESEFMAGRFVKVRGGFDYNIYVDTETKVMYWSNGTNGGVAAIIDADGKPILYKGEEN